SSTDMGKLPTTRVRTGRSRPVSCTTDPSAKRSWLARERKTSRAAASPRPFSRQSSRTVSAMSPTRTIARRKEISSSNLSCCSAMPAADLSLLTGLDGGPGARAYRLTPSTATMPHAPPLPDSERARPSDLRLRRTDVLEADRLHASEKAPTKGTSGPDGECIPGEKSACSGHAQLTALIRLHHQVDHLSEPADRHHQRPLPPRSPHGFDPALAQVDPHGLGALIHVQQQRARLRGLPGRRRGGRFRSRRARAGQERGE